MNSPIYNEWVAEERKEAADIEIEKAKKVAKEAAKEATLEASKKNLVELLEGRFDILQLSTRKNIKELKQESIDGLFRKAINISSIEDFEELLDKAIKTQG